MSAAAVPQQRGAEIARLKELIASDRSFARAASAPGPEAIVEGEEEPDVPAKVGALQIGARSVIWHYSRLLDRRVLHPILLAKAREEAIDVTAREWSWFLETTATIGRLFLDSKTEPERLKAQQAAAEDAERGARLAGDVDGEEMGFLVSTFESSRALALSLGNLQGEDLVPEDAALQASYGGSCQLYALGRLVLRVAPHVPGSGKPGLALAMELMRFGALHGYAAVRRAWEIRREPELGSDSGLLPVNNEDYAIALSR